MPSGQHAVVIDAVRTPMGRSRGGAFRHVRAEALSVACVQALLARNPAVEPGALDEVIWGCANQTGEQGFNVARQVGLMAGLPHELPAQTVNRLCGSSLQALNSAALAIAAGAGEAYLVGGVEHMGHVPMEHGLDIPAAYSLHGAKAGLSMGLTAEYLGRMHRISRADQDAFALRSHQRAAAAQAEGRFAAQIVPIDGHDADGLPIVVAADEVVRGDASLESLGALPPAFLPGEGTVTAGNASALSDGAAALLVLSEARAQALGLTPLARIRSQAVAGVDPSVMGRGPVPATQKALQRAGLTLADLDLIELNEAFAAQVLAVLEELGLRGSVDDKLNPNGGAIALGHPLGCSGARIATALLHEMRARDATLGLATMCIGLGQGIATVFERV